MISHGPWALCSHLTKGPYHNLFENSYRYPFIAQHYNSSLLSSTSSVKFYTRENRKIGTLTRYWTTHFENLLHCKCPPWSISWKNCSIVYYHCITIPFYPPTPSLDPFVISSFLLHPHLTSIIHSLTFFRKWTDTTGRNIRYILRRGLGTRRLAVHKPCHPWLRRAVFDVREGNSAASGGPETDWRFVFVSCRIAGTIDPSSPLQVDNPSLVTRRIPTSGSRRARSRVLLPSLRHPTEVLAYGANDDGVRNLTLQPQPLPSGRRTRIFAQARWSATVHDAALVRIQKLTEWETWLRYD